MSSTCGSVRGQYVSTHVGVWDSTSAHMYDSAAVHEQYMWGVLDSTSAHMYESAAVHGQYKCAFMGAQIVLARECVWGFWRSTYMHVCLVQRGVFVRLIAYSRQWVCVQLAPIFGDSMLQGC
jgi:hypothetical protein